jgi:N-acetylneuraminic acid mutarotase
MLSAPYRLVSSPARSAAALLTTLFTLLFTTQPNWAVLQADRVREAASNSAADAPLNWRSEPALSHARSAHALAATDTELYVIGGTGARVEAAGDNSAGENSVGGGASAPVPDELARPILEVERFDGRAWTELTRLPGEGLNAPAAVVFEQQLWVIGGFGTTSNVPVATVRVFDLAAHTWSEAAPLAAPRGGHAAIVYGGRIHVCGGGNSQTTLAEHCAFDPATRAWQTLAPLARPKGSPVAVVCDGKLWAIGGRSGNSDYGDVECYDAATQRWSPGPAIEPRGTAGAVVFRGSIYVLGGESQAQQRCLSSVLCLDPRRVAWRESTALPLARNYARAAVLGDAIYVVGGSTSPGSSHAGLGSTRVDSARRSEALPPPTK